MDTKSNDDSGGSDSLDKSMQRKCVMVETSPGEGTEPAEERDDNCSRDSAALRESSPPPGEPRTEANAGESSTAHKVNSNNNNNNNNNTNNNNNSNSNNNNNNTTAASAAFETKVKLISQNLKETTLTETTSNDIESFDTNSTDDCDHRIKKVRFHPDVKENDGGNRVKKKRKSSRNNNNPIPDCDGIMDMDDEDDDDENDDVDGKDEDFNLAKTIAEADDYLKQHPLTFSKRRQQQNGQRNRETPPNKEYKPQKVRQEVEVEENHVHSNSIKDFYKKCKPENGIDRILGKETKAGKMEFLLRYENKGGLFWETEEFVRRMCPTLLRAYEKNRERRQQRLMHHVAKRQSLRQRYTDF